MKNFVGLALVGALALLTGCATPASPQNIGGQYYLTGDANCKHVKAVTNNTIICFNSNHKWTGTRYAMTPQDIQMYQYERSRVDAMNRAAMQNTIQRPVQCVTNMGITTCY